MDDNDKKVNKEDKRRKRREDAGFKVEDRDKDSELSDDPEGEE